MDFHQNKIQSYAFMDIETTGLPQFNYGKTNITEICFYAISRENLLDAKNGYNIPRVTHKLTLYFNPERMIHPKASEISGLYNEMLEYETKFDKNAGETIINFIEHLRKPVCLVAHNGEKFDFPLLKKSLEKVNVKIPDHILCTDTYCAIKRIDELHVARHMLEDIDDIPSQIIFPKENINNESNNDVVDTNNDNKISNNIEETTINSSELEFLIEEIDTEKIDVQKINETTPKRITIKKISNVQQNNKNDNSNSNSNMISFKINKSHSLKSKRRLFSPSTSCLSPSSNRKQSFSPYGPKKIGYYRLSEIYNRIFNEYPKKSHEAEDDTRTLLHVATALGKDFIEYADENATKFSEIPTIDFIKILQKS